MKTNPEIYVIVKSNKSNMIVHQVVFTNDVELVKDLASRTVCTEIETVSFMKSKLNDIVLPKQ